ncbi:glutathione S-transferase [Mesorhizobium albiziae]|uniref:Glutathione S-transferase n=1 Tax=Neomesorhizobium albiziae TaxID=335020 RepID=A0A1I4DQL0_9HYPH|nr:glutathione S-transferase [Mesorhizobium albiziae]GLS33721.1 glutathione S-transferase [Mesorhizobium albiziae]SFK95968.1 glutathione S-transferase [Mesorhizobium albiziae]
MLKFYHSPWSRSSGVFWLLEELGQPYEIELVDIRAPGGVPEAYRAVQPNKKVPAIEHDGVVITERAAISVYLADRFHEAGLAPAIGEEARGPYLTTLVYCDSVFDPAISAKAQGWTYQSNNFSFGLFDDMVKYVEKKLTAHPYAAGDTFTAADTQLASGIGFTMNILKVLPALPVFTDYVARISERPAYQRAQARDAELIKQVTPPQF